jgi:hypothetical protein
VKYAAAATIATAPIIDNVAANKNEVGFDVNLACVDVINIPSGPEIGSSFVGERARPLAAKLTASGRAIGSRIKAVLPIDAVKLTLKADANKPAANANSTVTTSVNITLMDSPIVTPPSNSGTASAGRIGKRRIKDLIPTNVSFPRTTSCVRTSVKKRSPSVPSRLSLEIASAADRAPSSKHRINPPHANKLNIIRPAEAGADREKMMQRSPTTIARAATNVRWVYSAEVRPVLCNSRRTTGVAKIRNLATDHHFANRGFSRPHAG